MEPNSGTQHPLTTRTKRQHRRIRAGKRQQLQRKRRYTTTPTLTPDEVDDQMDAILGEKLSKKYPEEPGEAQEYVGGEGQNL